MRLRDRGMVKWAPYKSLPEQEDYLEKMEEEKIKWISHFYRMMN